MCMWYGMDRIGKERRKKKAENYTLRIIKTIFVTTQNRERRKVFLLSFFFIFRENVVFPKEGKCIRMDVTLYIFSCFVVGLLDDGNYIQ